MEILIKKVKKEDLPEFYNHYKSWVMELFPEYSENLKKKMTEKLFGKEYILERIKEGIVLVALSGENPVGMFMADPPLGGLSYGVWLMVDVNCQGKGIGKSLLERWEEEALKQGCHNLRLEADHRNVGFYERMGFKLIGIEEKGYFGTDNYLFQKIIAEPNEKNF